MHSILPILLGRAQKAYTFLGCWLACRELFGLRAGCGEPVWAGSGFWSSWIWLPFATLQEAQTGGVTSSEAFRSGGYWECFRWIWGQWAIHPELHPWRASLQWALLEYQQSSSVQGASILLSRHCCIIKKKWLHAQGLKPSVNERTSFWIGNNHNMPAERKSTFDLDAPVPICVIDVSLLHALFISLDGFCTLPDSCSQAAQMYFAVGE